MSRLTSDATPRSRKCVKLVYITRDEAGVVVEPGLNVCPPHLSVRIVFASRRQHYSRLAALDYSCALRFNKAVQFNNNIAGGFGGGVNVEGGDVT